MLFTGVFVAAAAFCQLAVAQSETASASITATASGASSSYTIDPSTQDSGTRQRWCGLQEQTCLSLCPQGQGDMNECDPETLDWTCTCRGGIQPNVSDYANTIPSLVCPLWKDACNANTTDAQVQADTCNSVVCGNKGTEALQSSYSASAEMASTSSSASGSATGSATGTETASTASETSTDSAAIALGFGQQYGMTGLVVALFTAFGFAL